MGNYIVEQDTLVLGEARGYADVFMRNHFAWENNAPGKNLDQALKQLLTYSLALSNPPLLVVSDRLTIRIHTQFSGHPCEIHTVELHDLDQPDKQALLHRLWTDPDDTWAHWELETAVPFARLDSWLNDASGFQLVPNSKPILKFS